MDAKPSLGLSFVEVVFVAGIIAVMAAAVSPVLASAREAQRSDLTNVKQLAVGVLIYGADADDHFPLAFDETPRGTRSSVAPFIGKTTSHWATSIYPYIKSEKIYAAVEAPLVVLEGLPPAERPLEVGYSFNGLLHTYDASAVTTPSQSLMFTQSYGFLNLQGYALSNPEMSCAIGQPCKYVSAESGCGGTESGTTSRLLAHDVPQYSEVKPKGGFARAQAYARIDGSAKAMIFEGAVASPYDAAEFMWSRLDEKAHAKAYWADAFGCHPLRFRPDYDPTVDTAPREVSRGG